MRDASLSCRIARFAGLDDADRAPSTVVRLIQLSGLGVAEGDPVPDSVVSGKGSRRDPPIRPHPVNGVPLPGNQGGATAGIQVDWRLRRACR